MQLKERSSDKRQWKVALPRRRTRRDAGERSFGRRGRMAQVDP